MKNRPGLSLQSKFVLITTVAIIVLMGIIGYMAVKREKDILYADVENQGRLLGETLAIPIINDLIYERLGLVEEGGLLDNYIMEIFNRKDVDLLYIAILDEDGKVISHNNITEYGKVYSDSLTVKALKANNTVVQQFSHEGDSSMDFGVPLSIGKKRWGTLKFGISLKKVEQESFATISKIIITTLFFLAGGFVIILFLSRRFIGPITQLANTMEKARSDYLDVKVDVKGSDELAVLGEKFNSMIERIKQANEELKKTHEKLVQSEKLASIGILASGVAHEINNPLGGLFNCHYFLKQNGDDPVLREKYLSLIGEGLERIENIVSKLLWTSRKGDHKPIVINIKDSVREAYSLVEYKVKKDNIRFINEISDGLSIFIDPHDFHQIILNLFINAIHAMKDGGILKVRGYGKDSKIKIDIMDTGIGIAQEHVGKIFDPFFTTKPPGEGTGLGLWLSYEIIRNYNGEILVESEPGKGSTFALSFPAKLN
ncbi:MAG: ATP-binding protein [Nitrospirae bacterium]|nr:ATP-binding protein [Nitrospirota bacterium]MCL5976806.1 ATP-binding protein [Nitrospirota bacterium]